MQLTQILSVLFESSRLVPTSSHEWVILPLVEEAQMLVIPVVEREHAEMLVKMGDISAVDDRAAFGLLRSSWVEGMDALLWEFAGRGEVHWVQGEG